MQKLDYMIHNGQLQLNLNGDYLGCENNSADHNILNEIETHHVKEILVNTNHLQKWDSTLVVLLYNLKKIALDKKINFNSDSLPKNLHQLLNLAFAVDRNPEIPHFKYLPFLNRVGKWGINLAQSTKKGLTFMHATLRSFGRILKGNAIMRRVDFLFALEDCSYKAIGIVSLVSFMVGLILAFVGAIQLKTFGAQIYVSSLVAIGMTRIMGAIMVGIIMAGRTGASFAASIGTMQVNEEVDALRTMGIPPSDFLVLPRIMALMISMPMLTLLADLMGIIGGATVGVFMLDISAPEYWQYTLKSLSMTNFWVGILHGFIFGIIISLCGCYYGINSGRNADSVGVSTTRAVVSAIVWMIVLTGIITWIFEAVGI